MSVLVPPVFVSLSPDLSEMSEEEKMGLDPKEYTRLALEESETHLQRGTEKWDLIDARKKRWRQKGTIDLGWAVWKVDTRDWNSLELAEARRVLGADVVDEDVEEGRFIGSTMNDDRRERGRDLQEQMTFGASQTTTAAPWFPSEEQLDALRESYKNENFPALQPRIGKEWTEAVKLKVGASVAGLDGLVFSLPPYVAPVKVDLLALTEEDPTGGPTANGGLIIIDPSANQFRSQNKQGLSAAKLEPLWIRNATSSSNSAIALSDDPSLFLDKPILLSAGVTFVKVGEKWCLDHREAVANALKRFLGMPSQPFGHEDVVVTAISRQTLEGLRVLKAWRRVLEEQRKDKLVGRRRLLPDSVQEG